MAKDIEVMPEVKFSQGQQVRCGGFVGVLSWVDNTVDPQTSKTSGDCNFVYLVQVPKGAGSGLHGFDGVYFAIKSFKTNTSQLKAI